MFMGRPGSGKGTQSQLLMARLNELDPSREVLHVETGAEFRKFYEGPSYTAKHSKEIIDSGKLMPVFMTVYAWGNALVARFKGNEHVIFDGTPRKLLETQLIEGVFPFYGLKPNVIYLDVHHDESKKRLILRGQTQGRRDDNEAGIRQRNVAYETEIQPSIDYLRKHPEMHFHDIDGIGSVEEVHARIMEKLHLD